MKRMIRYGMKPVRYRIVVINVLLALALTLLVNFSFFLIGADPRGRRPPIRTDYVVVQVVYFFVASWAVVSLNTVRRFSLVRKILLSVAATVIFYLLVPGLNRSGEWYVQLSAGRLYNPFLVMKASFMLVVSVLYGKIFELLYQKQHITIENERLKNENLQTQYNMLANQISPHFLFNSLNSLSMLVR